MTAQCANLYVSKGKERTCFDLHNCCDCGGHKCGCRDCFSCNACENCMGDEVEYDGAVEQE